jgi:hypothetical protein
MNLKDEDKQLLLYDSQMSDSSSHILTFINVDDVTKLKGIRRILQECELWVQGLGKQCNAYKLHISDLANSKCCVVRILSCQSNFTLQKNHLQEVIKAAGYLCIFYSKFYCKLNFIELFWREVKWYS